MQFTWSPLLWCMCQIGFNKVTRWTAPYTPCALKLKLCQAGHWNQYWNQLQNTSKLEISKLKAVFGVLQMFKMISKMTFKVAPKPWLFCTLKVPNGFQPVTPSPSSPLLFLEYLTGWQSPLAATEMFHSSHCSLQEHSRWETSMVMSQDSGYFFPLQFSCLKWDISKAERPWWSFGGWQQELDWQWSGFVSLVCWFFSSWCGGLTALMAVVLNGWLMCCAVPCATWS